MDFRQLGERPDVLDVVAYDAAAILDPRMRAKAPPPHPDANANTASANPVSLEHFVESHGADQAQGSEHSIVPGSAHSQTQLLSPAH
jgi:hypothetical protein